MENLPGSAFSSFFQRHKKKTRGDQVDWTRLVFAWRKCTLAKPFIPSQARHAWVRVADISSTTSAPSREPVFLTLPGHVIGALDPQKSA